MRINLYGIDDVKKNATQQRAIYFAAHLLEQSKPVVLHLDDSPGNRQLTIDLNLGKVSVFYPKAGAVFECIRKNVNIIQNPKDLHYIFGNGLRSLIITAPFSESVIIDVDELAFTHQRLSAWRRIYHFVIDIVTLLTNARYAVAGRAYCQFLKKVRPSISTVYTPNGFDARVLQFSHNKTKSSNGLLQFLYIGTISYTYQIADLIDVAKILKKTREQAKIIICGDGPDKRDFELRLKEQGLENHFDLVGHTEIAHLGHYLQRADAYLFPIEDNLQNWTRCPVKIYYYAAFGKPVLTQRVGEVTAWLKSTSTWYDSNDPKSLELAVLTVVKKIQTHVPNLPTNCTWEEQINQYWSSLRLCSDAPAEVK